jgi:hypothetical protein
VSVLRRKSGISNSWSLIAACDFLIDEDCCSSLSGFDVRQGGFGGLNMSQHIYEIINEKPFKHKQQKKLFQLLKKTSEFA